MTMGENLANDLYPVQFVTVNGCADKEPGSWRLSVHDLNGKGDFRTRHSPTDRDLELLASARFDSLARDLDGVLRQRRAPFFRLMQ